jgi:hypothetical protein
VNNPKLLADLIRKFYRDEVNISDDERMMKNMGEACNGCRDGFDLAGAEVWDKLFHSFALRNSSGVDAQRSETMAFYVLCFGMDFDSIQKNMRAFYFWKDVFPVIIEQLALYESGIDKYNPEGEYGKDPSVAKIMNEVSEKNVRVMMSILDSIKNTRSVWMDSVYIQFKALLRSDEPNYKKAIMGFIHLYYLVNRYGIIIEDEDLKELKKDADEWMLELSLGDQSLSFLKGLSEKMTDE